MMCIFWILWQKASQCIDSLALMIAEAKNGICVNKVENGK
jgi:hypothetical protein